MASKWFSFAPQRRNRFDFYDSNEDAPEISGLVNNENDYDLGTPSLNRKEDVTLVASNSSGEETLLLKLKWRPFNKTTVSLGTKFELKLKGECYEFEQLVAYEPRESSVKVGRILQYGGTQSNLKFFISAPYRRMRVSFHGHMRNKRDSSQVKFVKIGLVLSPTTGVYDFLEESGTKVDDRHEIIVRVVGDYTIISNHDQKLRGKLFTWGFYARQFLNDEMSSVMREKMNKRILFHSSDGRAFHLGWISASKQVQEAKEYGYTRFRIRPDTDSFDKPPVLDWSKMGEDTQEARLEVNGQGKSFECCLKARSDGLANFYDATMDGKPGWAWLSVDDVLDSEAEREAFEQCFSQYQLDLDQGNIARQPSFKETQEGSLVIDINDELCALSELVGAKAASLAQLSSFSAKSVVGVRPVVPNALVLSRAAHDVLFERDSHIKDRVAHLERFLGEGQLVDLREECKNLQMIIKGTLFPEKMRNELASKLVDKFGADWQEKVAFAVRSSSWGEDEEDMSAAGQLTTLLNVRGLEQLQAAVLACFASKFSFENVEYKRQHGLPLSLPMAVVLQEMIQCEKAGVMFTCNPTTGDDRVLTITANYGLGESVVSGQADPDTITVIKDDLNGGELRIGQIHIGQKKVIIENSPGNHDDTNRRSICCLGNDEILKLAKCGQAIGKYFGSLRDIEWGYKGNELYLFQSRPVTGLDNYTDVELVHESDTPSQAEVEFYTRANIGEVMPYAIKPLTLTYGIFLWNVLGHRMHQKFVDKEVFRPQVAGGEIVVDSYHSLFRLRCSVLFRVGETSGEKSIIARAVAVSFFGHEIGDQPDIVEASRGFDSPIAVFETSKFKLRTMPLRNMPITVVMRQKNLMRRLRNEVRELKHAQGYKENKMLGLLNQFKALSKYAYTCWENHIMIIIIANRCNVGLSAILSKYIKDPVQLFTSVTKFLAISEDVISAEIPQRIAEMAQQIRAKGEVESERFVAMQEEDALAYLEKEIGEKYTTFIERFGHRCYNEFEISEPSWRDKPAIIVDMLKKNCQAKSEQLSGTKRAKTFEEVVESLGLTDKLTFKDWAILKYLIVPKCTTLVSAREHTKDILIEFYDIVREASKMFAIELRRNLRIPDENLLYYFFYDELEPLTRAPQPSLVMQAIRRRSMFKKMYSEPWKFDEIISGYELIPNHMLPSVELDETLANAPKLFGTPASSGRVQARVCLVRGYTELGRIRAGDILLTHSTDIAFSPVFPLVSGIITEVGGLISHGAVVAREYGLPSVLGIPNVTRILQDGEEIILDADNGTIIRLTKGDSNGVSNGVAKE